MGLKAGSYNDIANSMAHEMEQAFQTQWNIAKDKSLADSGEDDRKILFAAIAQGVLSHLQQHINTALRIEIEAEQTSSSMINSSNATVSVTQDGGSSNRVVSSGEAINIELLTDD